MSRAVVHKDGGMVATVAPLAGCAVATAAITVVSEKTDVEKEKLAIAAAALGVGIATQTGGVARHIGMGIAAAGIATGIAEVMRHWKARMAPPDEPVTREEFEKVVEARQKNDAQTIAALRQEVAQLKAQLAKAPVAKTPPKRDAAPATKKPPSFMSVATDEQGKKLDAILRQFDEHDRAKLIGIYESLPKATVDQMFRIVEAMPVHEAVNFVRNNVLLKS